MESWSLHCRVLNVIRDQRLGYVKIAIKDNIFHTILILPVQSFKQFIALSGICYAFNCRQLDFVITFMRVFQQLL